jgi:hypothetical protein
MTTDTQSSGICPRAEGASTIAYLGIRHRLRYQSLRTWRSWAESINQAFFHRQGDSLAGYPDLPLIVNPGSLLASRPDFQMPGPRRRYSEPQRQGFLLRGLEFLSVLLVVLVNLFALRIARPRAMLSRLSARRAACRRQRVRPLSGWPGLRQDRLVDWRSFRRSALSRRRSRRSTVSA